MSNHARSEISFWILQPSPVKRCTRFAGCGTRSRCRRGSTSSVPERDVQLPQLRCPPDVLCVLSRWEYNWGERRQCSWDDIGGCAGRGSASVDAGDVEVGKWCLGAYVRLRLKRAADGVTSAGGDLLGPHAHRVRGREGRVHCLNPLRPDCATLFNYFPHPWPKLTNAARKERWFGRSAVRSGSATRSGLWLVQ